MAIYGVSYDSAMLTCRKSRHCVYPNPGFQHQLREYDKSLQRRRYGQDQRTGGRYLNDYSKLNDFLNKNSRLASQQAAGLDCSHWQFNKSGVKDRLGSHALVRKGTSRSNVNFYSPTNARSKINALERTKSAVSVRAGAKSSKRRPMLRTWR
jgi:hypothetical protein